MGEQGKDALVLASKEKGAPPAIVFFGVHGVSLELPHACFFMMRAFF